MKPHLSTDQRMAAVHLAADRARADHAEIRAHVDQRVSESRSRMAATRRLIEDSRRATAQVRRVG